MCNNRKQYTMFVARKQRVMEIVYAEKECIVVYVAYE